MVNELLEAVRSGSDRDLDGYLEVRSCAEIRRDVLSIADGRIHADAMKRAVAILRQGSDEFGRYGSIVLQSGMAALADEIEGSV
jgi:hypothetical protein